MGVPWCPLQPTNQPSLHPCRSISMIPKWCIYSQAFIPWFSGLLRHTESNGGWGTMARNLRSPNGAFVTTRCLPMWTKVNSTARSLSVVNLKKFKQWRKALAKQLARRHGVEQPNWKTPSANLICFLYTSSLAMILDSMHGWPLHFKIFCRSSCYMV